MSQGSGVVVTAVVVAAAALSACGERGQPQAAVPQTIVTVTAAATGPTAAAGTAVTGATGPSTATVAPKPRAAPATMKKPPRRRARSAAPAAPVTEAPAMRAAAVPALRCLRQARLVKPRRRSDGIWGGNDRGSGRPVLVDGPYATAGEAAGSAASLEAVSLAQKGGRYVVSASLRSKLGSTVEQVARCLEART